jgi:antitoxin (DNA-binding transcriptional repressor) of toxin-antitoxin stability system
VGESLILGGWRVRERTRNAATTINRRMTQALRDAKTGSLHLSMMTMWNIAAAKQSLTQVIRDAQSAPQIIANRGKPVAAVIAIEFLPAVQQAMAAQPLKLTDLLASLREASLEQQDEFPVASRADRTNAFTELTDSDLR